MYCWWPFLWYFSKKKAWIFDRVLQQSCPSLQCCHLSNSKISHVHTCFKSERSSLEKYRYTSSYILFLIYSLLLIICKNFILSFSILFPFSLIYLNWATWVYNSRMYSFFLNLARFAEIRFLYNLSIFLSSWLMFNDFTFSIFFLNDTNGTFSCFGWFIVFIRVSFNWIISSWSWFSWHRYSSNFSFR